MDASLLKFIIKSMTDVSWRGPGLIECLIGKEGRPVVESSSVADQMPLGPLIIGRSSLQGLAVACLNSHVKFLFSSLPYLLCSCILQPSK